MLTRIIGDDEVEAVEIQRKEGLKPFQLAVRGVLIRIGVEPNTELFREQLETDEKGFISDEQSTGDERADGVCSWRRFESDCADDQRRHWRGRNRG